MLYIDLNQFKAYNDAYGYDEGDRVLKGLSRVLVDQLRGGAGAEFVGHIGGDDFIVLSTPDKMEALARLICDAFDAIVPSFYSEEDRKRGSILAKDRQGNMKEFPFLSVAIGICHTRERKLTGFAQVAHLGAELKKVAKGMPGSAYVVDRRKD